MVPKSGATYCLRKGTLICIGSGSPILPAIPPPPAPPAPAPIELASGVEAAPTLAAKLLTEGGSATSMLQNLKIPINIPK